VETIFKFSGDKEIINLVKWPRDYLKIYNRAASNFNRSQKYNYPLYSPELLRIFDKKL
jgi:hypothetical protein